MNDHIQQLLETGKTEFPAALLKEFNRQMKEYSASYFTTHDSRGMTKVELGEELVENGGEG